MPEDVLSLRALNRATLARQMLVERARVGVAEAVRRMASVQAQHPGWPRIALWTRIADHGAADLADALARREVVRASLMRVTLHVVYAGDYWHFAAVTRPMRQTQFRLIFKEDPTQSQVKRRLRPAHDAALAALAERPRSMAELRAIMAAALPSLAEREHDYLWRYLTATVPLVDVPPPEGDARYGRSWYATADQWLGPQPDDADRPRAIALLVESYLAAYGPASRDDIVAWVGRLSVPEVKGALAALGDRLARYHDESGRELFDLVDAPRPDPDTAAPVRLLTRWDSLLLGHATKFRTRVLPAEHHAAVNRPNGDVLPTFLVDGLVAGTWRYETGTATAKSTRHVGKGLIELVALSKLRPADRRALEGEARALGRFLDLGDDPEIRFAET